MSVLVALATAYASLLALVFVHELGHYVVARMLGYPVDLVAAGAGAVLLSVETPKTVWQLRMMPTDGTTRVEFDRVPELWHMVVIAVAGPALSLAAGIGLMASTVALSTHDLTPLATVYALFLVGAISALIFGVQGFLPFPTGDGRVIWDLIMRRRIPDSDPGEPPMSGRRPSTSSRP